METCLESMLKKIEKVQERWLRVSAEKFMLPNLATRREQQDIYEDHKFLNNTYTTDANHL